MAILYLRVVRWGYYIASKSNVRGINSGRVVLMSKSLIQNSSKGLLNKLEYSLKKLGCAHDRMTWIFK